MTYRYSKLTERNYRKNRTIVSDDISGLLSDIAETLGLELTVHSYPSESEIGTWVVPPSWNVREAWIKDSRGRIRASYDDHPLFLVPYSLPFEGKVSLDELKAHTRVHPTQRDAYFYEHRFAYHFQQRLSDWAITLPASLLESLERDEYEVKIDLDIKSGEMLIGEFVLPGKTEQSIALLADHCHPGQVNDSWSGILSFIDVIGEVKKWRDRRYTYRFLIFPETIGSCVLLADKPEYIDKTDLAIFSEFVGWGRDWRILATPGRDSKAMRLAHVAASEDPEFTVDDLFCGYGNDERVFDFAGVPSMSVQMIECDEYHSSNDHPRLLDQDNIDKATKNILRICDLMERDLSLKFKQRVPIYQTRFDLYSDSVHDSCHFHYNREINTGIRDGLSLVDIAHKKNVPFDYVCEYSNRLLEAGLVENTGLT